MPDSTESWIPRVSVERLLVFSTLLTLLLQRSSPFANIAIYLALIVASYLTDRCITPPNPNPDISDTVPSGPGNSKGGVERASLPEDTVRFVTSQLFIVLVRTVIYIFGVYHALLALDYSTLSMNQSHQFARPHSSICPRQDLLNPSLFTWTLHSTICIIAIIAGSALRILAYQQLGKNFTFRLAQPSELVGSTFPGCAVLIKSFGLKLVLTKAMVFTLFILSIHST
jgi:hypothetical protein